MTYHLKIIDPIRFFSILKSLYAKKTSLWGKSWNYWVSGCMLNSSLFSHNKSRNSIVFQTRGWELKSLPAVRRWVERYLRQFSLNSVEKTQLFIEGINILRLTLSNRADNSNLQLFNANKDKVFRQYKHHKHLGVAFADWRFLSLNESILSQFDHKRRLLQIFATDQSIRGCQTPRD